MRCDGRDNTKKLQDFNSIVVPLKIHDWVFLLWNDSKSIHNNNDKDNRNNNDNNGTSNENNNNNSSDK